jgi:hypothetical protein
VSCAATGTASLVTKYAASSRYLGRCRTAAVFRGAAGDLRGDCSLAAGDLRGPRAPKVGKHGRNDRRQSSASFGPFRPRSRDFALLHGQLAISGRTVQIGLVMRFLRLSRSLCGPKSRAVPAPAWLAILGLRTADGPSRHHALPCRYTRISAISRARGAPVVVGPPHEDKPRIHSLAKRPQHAHRVRSHRQRRCPKNEAGLGTMLGGGAVLGRACRRPYQVTCETDER